MKSDDVKIGEKYFTRVSRGHVLVIVTGRIEIRGRIRFGVARADGRSTNLQARSGAALHERIPGDPLYSWERLYHAPTDRHADRICRGCTPDDQRWSKRVRLSEIPAESDPYRRKTSRPDDAPPESVTRPIPRPAAVPAFSLELEPS